jgi:uncharacterized membrane protein YkoI
MRKKSVVITGAAAAAVVLGGATVAGATNTLSGGDQPLAGSELQQARDAALAHTGGGTVTEAEVENGLGSAYELEVQLPDGSRTEVNLDSSFKVSGTERDDDSGGPALTADERDRAANAALAKVGQGSVSEVEREGGGAYEVEIRLNDGSQVEVQVGPDFQALNQSAPEFDDD